jgi:hypothetical protein
MFGTSIVLPMLNASQLCGLLTERQIFHQDRENYSAHLHLQYIVECLGSFPPEFLHGCEDQKRYFDEKGKHTLPTVMTPANVFIQVHFSK